MAIKDQPTLTSELADNTSGDIHAAHIRDVVDTMFSLNLQVTTPPTAANDPGEPGQFCIDAANNKVFACTAKDTWVEATITFTPVA
jgi:hypothetical protein